VNNPAAITQFLKLLWIEDRLSEYTRKAYGSDLTLFADWLQQTGQCDVLAVSAQEISSYLAYRHQCGERQTVSRYAQHVIRSFVVWGVLKDADANLAILLVGVCTPGHPGRQQRVGTAPESSSILPVPAPAVDR